MRKTLSILVILSVVIVACQKLNPNMDTNINNGTTTSIASMSDLTISDAFDWKLIKTLDVEIELPESDASRILYIYSSDGERLYFKGHSEDGSNILKTRVSFPTYEDAVKLKYGFGNDYPAIETSLNNSGIKSSINSELKTVIVNGGCDEDWNDDISTFGGYQFVFNAMIENMDGTSTWTYTITGTSPAGPSYKDLSHWVMELCDDHRVVEATPSDYITYITDPSLNIYGIKWNKEINKNGGSMIFSVTLGQYYDIGLINIGFKTDQNLHYCTIKGPGCSGGPGPNPTPDFEGTLAFEDLWPGKGDYDLNDLVVEYGFDITKDNSEFIEHIQASFEIRAFGAGLHNGFGFSLPGVDPEDILSVTGYEIASGSIYNILPNGVEQGQRDATFIVFDDPFRLMPHPGQGIGVNTETWAPYVTPVTIVLEIEFAHHAVTFSQLNIGKFNPFLITNQNRETEVHLPNYWPTDLINAYYFGTYADDTNPPTKFYLTEDNLPWAINIPDKFDYPIEKKPIIWAYYHFAEWAQSNGEQYSDWYKDLHGYRYENAIY